VLPRVSQQAGRSRLLISERTVATHVGHILDKARIQITGSDRGLDLVDR